jgi:hypothetical protein
MTLVTRVRKISLLHWNYGQYVEICYKYNKG